jgi:hypothetical protein
MWDRSDLERRNLLFFEVQPDWFTRIKTTRQFLTA